MLRINATMSRKIVVFILGWHLMIFLLVPGTFIRGRHSFEGGVYSNNYGMYKNHVINVNQMVKYAPSRCAIQQKRIYNKTIENFHDTLPRFCHFCEQTSKQSSTNTVSSVVLL